MTEHVSCDQHGESLPTFVCHHLVGGSGLGFFYADDPGNPRPDAWCKACDDVLTRVGEWNDESEAFANITLLCSACYDEAKRRNCDRRFTFRCNACSQIHHGTPGYGWDHPVYLLDVPESERAARVVLTDTTCTIDGQYFYVRGNLDVPVIDAAESLIFGVWVSLSAKHFQRYQDLRENPDRVKEPPMVGWLSSSIKSYPNTLKLKARIWQRAPGHQPFVELEPTDHPLAVQQREGVDTKKLTLIYEKISPGRFIVE